MDVCTVKSLVQTVPTERDGADSGPEEEEWEAPDVTDSEDI